MSVCNVLVCACVAVSMLLYVLVCKWGCVDCVGVCECVGVCMCG